MSVLTRVLKIDWRSWRHAHFWFRLLHKRVERPLSLEVLFNDRQDLDISGLVHVGRNSTRCKAIARQRSR